MLSTHTLGKQWLNYIKNTKTNEQTKNPLNPTDDPGNQLANEINRHLSKGKVQMANGYMKKYSASLAAEKGQNNPGSSSAPCWDGYYLRQHSKWLGEDEKMKPHTLWWE